MFLVGILLTVPRRCFFCGSFLFVFLVCRVFLSGHCSLVVTSWERDDLLALLCVVFNCVFYVPMWCPGSGVVINASFRDRCLYSYFYVN